MSSGCKIMNADFRSQLSQLLSSGQFDAEWYMRRYPDVLQTGMGPAEHYLWLGKRIGRRGKPSNPGDELIDLGVFKPRAQEAGSGKAQRADAGVAHAAPTAEAMIDRLADWPGLDKAYVCYQLGIEPQKSARRVAELYYNEIRNRNILPNALFDPEYYSYYNDLNFGDDEIYHYITVGAGKKFHTHSLFDLEWYLSKYPEAKDSADLLVDYWSRGYRERLLPIDPEKVPVLDSIRAVFFSNVFDCDSHFDVATYRQFNKDLANMPDAELATHFEKVGRAENRIGSLTTLLRDAGLPGHCIPVDFDPKQYVSLHVDLEKEFSENPWLAIPHFVRSGFKEKRRYSFHQIGSVRPILLESQYHDVAPLVGKKPFCVLVHLYYPDMWDELRAYIANIDVDFDLYVNFVESTWLGAVMAQVREDFPKAKIKISPNEGRDIGGFFSLLKGVNFADYVAFTLLHSKKSPHVTRDYAAMWKKSLLGAILGDSETVRQNLTAFLTDPEIGIVGSVQTRHLGLESNAAGMRKLFQIYGISPEHEECEYVSGTMMMVRSEVMEAVYLPLAHHQFVNGDNKGIEHHIDGQVEHSVERIFGNVMRQLGYRFLWR